MTNTTRAYIAKHVPRNEDVVGTVLTTLWLEGTMRRGSRLVGFEAATVRFEALAREFLQAPGATSLGRSSLVPTT
jgi:hypothetical protein